MSESVQVVDYLDEFMVALKEQLLSDAKRWEDAWLCSPVGQEKYTTMRFVEYYKQFKAGGESLPWLKVAGGALICWIRENHPEILSDEPCYDPGSEPEMSE